LSWASAMLQKRESPFRDPNIVRTVARPAERLVCAQSRLAAGLALFVGFPLAAALC